MLVDDVSKRDQSKEHYKERNFQVNLNLTFFGKDVRIEAFNFVPKNNVFELQLLNQIIFPFVTCISRALVVNQGDLFFASGFFSLSFKELLSESTNFLFLYFKNVSGFFGEFWSYS